MDDIIVMFVFIRVMLADVSYVSVNESYHYKMAFGLYASLKKGSSVPLNFN